MSLGSDSFRGRVWLDRAPNSFSMAMYGWTEPRTVWFLCTYYVLIIVYLSPLPPYLPPPHTHPFRIER